jgi:iron transport multicopper oxidase
MNGITYIPPVVPILYTTLSTPQNISTDPTIYGPNTNVVVFNNTVGIVEIVINNFDSGAHPFHIHGHVAKIVAQVPAGTNAIQQVENDTRTTFPPANRDVFMVEKYSYTIIRFKSGNPGI